MKKIIAFILALVSAITLCACKGNGKEKADGEQELFFTDENGKSRFTIVLGAKEDLGAKSYASFLSTELRKSVGSIVRVTDSSKVKEDKKAYEILIGDTGRSESKSLSKGISDSEYRIKVIGRKIVIVGGNDAALSRGIGELLFHINSETKSVAKTLNVSGTIGSDSPILVGMSNGTTHCIEVYDISLGRMDESSLLWSSNTTRGAAGFKLRQHPTYGEVVLATTGTYAYMMSYETKKILWSTENTPENSHSIELMPNGIIAVGGTVGHDIHFYNLNSDDPTEIKFEVPHNDAHGLLWDPKNEILWGAGSNMLNAYRVTVGEDGSVNVEKDEEMSVITPEGSLHDLQPYFGNTDWLLITTKTKALIYDKVNKTFTDAFEGVTNATTASLKGIGRFPNGDMIYIYPDGLYEQWNSTILNFIQSGEVRISVPINSPMGRFYKCRVWTSDYQ